MKKSLVLSYYKLIQWLFKSFISLLQSLSRYWLNEAISFLYTEKTVFSKNLNLKDESQFSEMKTFRRFVCTEASKDQIDEEIEMEGSKCNHTIFTEKCFLKQNLK